MLQIDRISHYESIEPGVAATCTAVGYTERIVCGGCGMLMKEREAIPKLPHTEITLPGVAPTVHTPGYTEGKRCTVCGQITATQKVQLLGGYITDQEMRIETERFVLLLPKGVHVPDTLLDDIDLIMTLTEEITGLSYYSDYAKELVANWMEKKVIVQVELTGDDSEAGGASGGVVGAYLSPADLLIRAGHMDVMTHELLHCLHRRNGSFIASFCAEGFTTYWTKEILEKQVLFSHFDSYQNYSVYPENITPETAESVLLSTAEEDDWNNYLYGFRLMHYIVETGLFDGFMALSRHALATRDSGMESASVGAALLKEYFGEDFFAEFAVWYQKNAQQFSPEPEAARDYSGFTQVDMYPFYGAWNFYESMRFTYKDRIAIEFANGFSYGSLYKKTPRTGSLVVRLSGEGEAKAHFYDVDGNLIKTAMLTRDETEHSVIGATRLVIEGDGKPVLVAPQFEGIFS